MKDADNIAWKCFAFQEISNTLLYNILAERAKVFVVEQNCPYNDIDGIDMKSHHLIGFYNNEIAAYARLVTPEVVYKEMSIGRVMTPQHFRNKGFGKLLVEQAIDKSYDIFEEGDIKIDAQLYLKRFYEHFGFKQVDEPHEVDGIPHIYMQLKKK
jgi:ElaA protein